MNKIIGFLNFLSFNDLKKISKKMLFGSPDQFVIYYSFIFMFF